MIRIAQSIDHLFEALQLLLKFRVLPTRAFLLMDGLLGDTFRFVGYTFFAELTVWLEDATHLASATFDAASRAKSKAL